MALTEFDKREAEPFALALTLERVKILNEKLRLEQEINQQLRDQLEVTAVSRMALLRRLAKVNEALNG